MCPHTNIYAQVPALMRASSEHALLGEGHSKGHAPSTSRRQILGDLALDAPEISRGDGGGHALGGGDTPTESEVLEAIFASSSYEKAKCDALEGFGHGVGGGSRSEGGRLQLGDKCAAHTRRELELMKRERRISGKTFSKKSHVHPKASSNAL